MVSENLTSKKRRSHPIVREDVFDVRLGPSLDRLAKANPDNALDVASSQIGVMDVYYKEVLGQARKSFYSAWIATLLGLLVLVGSIVFFQISRNQNITIVGMISAALFEFIAGVNFVLHGRTSDQLSVFHQRLDLTQRFLIAHSICESLEGEYQQRARIELVRRISGESSDKAIEPMHNEEDKIS
jgi:hypothetical protein